MLNAITAIVFTLLISASVISHASDHVDGQISLDNPVADITDLFAFPSPDKPGHLVLILNSYPFLPAAGHFSDRLVYSFLLRPLAISGRGKDAAFRSDGDDYRIDCTFITPHDSINYYVNCTAPNGEIIRGRVDQEEGIEAAGIRLFAGRRSDPFLINTDWFASVVFNSEIPSVTTASSDLEGTNVLSIVLELDSSKIFKSQDRHLFAVAGETRHLSDDEYNPDGIIDRLGRPEITNSRLVATLVQDDLRDSYNQQAVFDLDDFNKWLYQTRLLDNITYYDILDGTKDWLPGWKLALSNLLIEDYLVIDIQKPFTPQSYFDVEYSLLRKQPHTRSGGRVPGDNILNTLMTTMITGGHGAVVADGIETRLGLPNVVFPYLAAPVTGPTAEAKADFLRQASAQFLLLKRP